MAGISASTTNIATSGAYQTADSGGYDITIVKFNPGGALLWATYYGGYNDDDPRAICVDKKDYIYIAGLTSSNNGIATKNSFQTVRSGSNANAFLSKFSSAGKIVWGTYFGGKDYTVASSITTDAEGNVYMAGSTGCNSGIATKGAYQTSITGYSGVISSFIAKFNSSDSIIWSTYYGNSNAEVSGLALDGQNNVYVCGSASGGDLATSGAFQSALSGYSDAFLAKFGSNGDKLIWGSYFGSPYMYSDISGTGIVLDSKDNIYITGDVNYTGSYGIATNGAAQTAFAGASDAFLAKISNSGSQCLWSTYWGGTDDDRATAIVTDSKDNIYITGPTASTDFPVTSGATQSSLNGSYNSFLAKFSSSGVPTFSSYYGGSGATQSYGICIDGNDDVFLTGNTSSPSHIATSGAYQTSFGGSQDAFLAKFTLGPCKFKPAISSNPVLCQNTDMTYIANKDSGLTYVWRATGDSILSGQNTDSIRLKWLKAGIDTLSLIESLNGCKDSVRKGIDILSNTGVDIGKNKEICIGQSAVIGDSTIAPNFFYTYSWSSKPKGFTSTKTGAIVKPSVSTWYYLTKTNDTLCSTVDSILITVNALPKPRAGVAKSICIFDSTNLGDTALKGYIYSWTSIPSGFTSTLANPKVAPYGHTIYTLAEKIDSTGCKSRDVVSITVNGLPIPNPGKDKTICNGQSVELGANSENGESYSWTSMPNGFTSTVSDPKANPHTSTKYLLKQTTDSTGCSSVDSVFVTVNRLPVPMPGIAQSICFGDSASLGDTTDSKWHTYSWSSNPAGFSSTLAAMKVSPKVNTLYYLTEESDSTNCSAIDSVLVTVFHLPVIHIMDSRNICLGDSVILGSDTTTVNDLFSWSSNPSGFSANIADPKVSPGYATTYYMTKSRNGCKSIDSVTVTIFPRPILNLGHYKPVCESGDTVSLHGQPMGGYWFGNGVSDSSGNYFYDPGKMSAGDDQLVYLYNYGVGCKASDTVSVRINSLPIVNAGNDTSVCSNVGAIELKGKANSNNGVFTWSGGGVKKNMFDTYTAGVGYHALKLHYIDSNSCANSASVTYNVVQIPKVKFGTDSLNGYAPFYVPFIDSTSGQIVDQSWNFGDSTSSNNTSTFSQPTHVYGFPGIYSVSLKVYAINNCDSTLIKKQYITVLQKSGIKGIEVNNDIAAYPNPVHDRIYIKWPGIPAEEFTYRIVNSLGEDVEYGKISPESDMIILTGIKGGMYYLILDSQGTHLTRKFIKL